MFCGAIAEQGVDSLLIATPDDSFVCIPLEAMAFCTSSVLREGTEGL